MLSTYRADVSWIALEKILNGALETWKFHRFLHVEFISKLYYFQLCVNPNTYSLYVPYILIKPRTKPISKSRCLQYKLIFMMFENNVISSLIVQKAKTDELNAHFQKTLYKDFIEIMMSLVLFKCTVQQNHSLVTFIINKNRETQTNYQFSLPRQVLSRRCVQLVKRTLLLLLKNISNIASENCFEQLNNPTFN